MKALTQIFAKQIGKLSSPLKCKFCVHVVVLLILPLVNNENTSNNFVLIFTLTP